LAWVQQKANGKWLARWREPSGSTRSMQFNTKAEAEREAERHASEALVKAVVTGPGIEEYAAGVRFDNKRNRWLNPDGTPWVRHGIPRALEAKYGFANYVRAMVDANRELRDSTRELYLRNIRNHIEGTEFGDADIRVITPEMVSSYWAGLDIGVGALRNVQQLLSKAFNRALMKGLIDVSPLKRAPDVKRPSKSRRQEVIPLTVDDLEKLAAAAKYPRDRLEILVMGYGGLRAGEVGGLRRQDVDFERCRLNLRQQVVRVTGRGMYVSPLKTEAARRPVTLPCSLTDELKKFVKKEPPADDGRVFHGPNGEMRAHTAINHGVQTAAKRAGFLPVNAHRLRHTAVSLLIEEGANPKSIQAFVGHSDIRMTLGTYGHLFDYGGQKLADLLEARREKYRNGGVSQAKAHSHRGRT
jgi:integrase